MDRSENIARRLVQQPAARGNGGMTNATVCYESVTRMSRAEYRTWIEQQTTGRYERVDGVVVAVAPERIAHARVAHARVKARTWQALDWAIRTAGVACEALPDSVTVEVGDGDYEPDAIVQCGPLDPNALTADRPLVIVEGTSSIDRAWKLREYLRLSSIHHYLIIWADKQQIVHHRRATDDSIETSILGDGEVRLDPPGITITVEEIYAA